MRTTIILLGTAIATAFGPAAPAQAQSLNPTHYQCYRLAVAQSKAVTVKLQDQFGVSPKVLVGNAMFLCAPTSKNGSKVSDPNTHYLCYQDEGVKAPEKKVRVTNQFGTLDMTVEGPTWLCLPSSKKLL
jgi:hypothetical protein